MGTNADDMLACIQTAWHRFVSTGHIDTAAVRTEVAHSWRRCRANGVDPHARKASAPVSEQRLSAVRKENTLFMETALPFMEFLRIAVKGTGFILALTESSGIVLDVFGDGEILSMATENNYVPGCSRAENVAGTNAIGLALIEKRAIQLTGAEHWNERHHRWTCSSAPVFSPAGKLLGAITLSGETTRAHRHTLGMVISAAEAVQERLREQAIAQEKRGIDVILSSVLKTISEAIVTIDSNGIITNINPAAAKTLRVEGKDFRGKSLLKLFSGNSELMKQLAQGRDGGSFEVVADHSGARHQFLITPYVMRVDSTVKGAILAVRERREFLNEVCELSGFNASFTFEDIIGKSPALLHQIEVARVAAQQSTRILILGETGTGKELFAQSIHNSSPHRRGPFVALNCAAIPRELMESEIFGYRAGAFTGARKGGQVGKLELADGGTIFLDEINQMPLDLQSKLLRALQEGTITRLGDTKPVRINVRVIAAANEDLYAKSCTGEFRQDLYYRLSVVELNLPPLRQRSEDIPLIAQHLLQKLEKRMGKSSLSLSGAAVELLCKYPWPGNVRELENVLEMGAIMVPNGLIEPVHLAYRMRTNPVVETGARDTRFFATEGRSMRDVEIDLIRDAIDEHNGNVTEAARKLGLSRATVYRRMHQHRIVKTVTVR